jgi:hypothetical protein
MTSPALSFVVLVAVLVAIAASIVGDLELLSSTPSLSVHNPAAHALDVFSDEESFNVDQAGDVQPAVLRGDDGTLHIPDTGVNRSQIADAACPTRSPPSA